MILLTGATGFLGSYFLKALLEKGVSVRALYRQPERIEVTLGFLQKFGISKQKVEERVDWFQADLLDLVRLEESFVGIDTIIHCAAVVSFHKGDRELLRKVNVEGTANMVHLSLKHRIASFCFISSVGALGHVDPPARVNEKTPWNQEKSNYYGWTKREAELEVWKGMQEGLRSLIVNPGVILGPGPWKQGSPSIYHKVQRGLRFYPPSSIGIVSAVEVTRLTLKLLEKEAFKDSFILVQGHWDYKKLLGTLRAALHGKPGRLLRLPLWLLRGISLIDSLQAGITGKPLGLTREVIRSFSWPVQYNNQKAQDLLDYTYPDLQTDLMETARKYYGKKD